MTSCSYYTHKSVYVRVVNSLMDGQIVEVFDECTQEWLTMNSISVKPKRKREESSCCVVADISRKRKRVTLDCLPKDVILHILSFREYFVLDRPANKLQPALTVQQLYGRFGDGSIHNLFPNISLSGSFRADQQINDLLLSIKQCKILNINCALPDWLVNNVNRCCPYLETVHLLLPEQINYCMLYDKISTLYIESNMTEMCNEIWQCVAEMKHLKTLITAPGSIYPQTLFNLLENCYCKSVKFVLPSLHSIQNPVFPLHIVNKNTRIQHLEIETMGHQTMQFDLDQLKTIRPLKTFRVVLNKQELHALAQNPNVSSIESIVLCKLSDILPVAIELLSKMKNLKNLELFISQKDICALSKLIPHILSPCKIELTSICYSDVYELHTVKYLLRAFQHKSIEIT